MQVCFVVILRKSLKATLIGNWASTQSMFSHSSLFFKFTMHVVHYFILGGFKLIVFWDLKLSSKLEEGSWMPILTELLKTSSCVSYLKNFGLLHRWKIWKGSLVCKAKEDRSLLCTSNFISTFFTFVFCVIPLAWNFMGILDHVEDPLDYSSHLVLLINISQCVFSSLFLIKVCTVIKVYLYNNKFCICILLKSLWSYFVL